MKTIKIKKALLLTLTLFAALQPLTATCKEEDTGGSWWSNTIFSTISKCYNTAITQIKKHPYMTASAAVFLTVAVTGLAALYQKKQKEDQLKKQQEEEKKIEQQKLEEKKKIEQQKLEEEEEEEEEEEKAIKLLEQQEQENNKKKNEKIEKEETTKDFKYTASMAHLMTVLPGKIILRPKPLGDETPKTWLWSDGVLSENGTKYSVTYKNKTYVSSYETKNNHWYTDDPKNQMDYFTYYDYLVANGKWEMGKMGPEKEKFMEYLIRKAIETHPNVFFSSGKVEVEKIGYLIKIFKENMFREELHSEKIAFYNGYSAKIDYMYAFVSSLHKYLDIDEKPRERTRFEETKKTEETEETKVYNSINEFLDEKKFSEHINDRTYSNFLMSTNIYLFGNIDDAGECSCYYCCSGKCAVLTSDTCVKYVEKLRKKLGLKLKCKEKLEGLFKKYEESCGKLKQIFISPEKVDTIAYISKKVGHQLPNDDPLKTIFSQKDGPTPKNVVSLLRTNPQNELLCLPPYVDHRKYIDQIQARIHHFNKAFFNHKKATKYGLEIFYSFAQEGACEKQEKLDEQMDILVKDMLWHALKKGALKGGAEETKLATLYNANKITEKAGLQIDNLKKLVNEEI